MNEFSERLVDRYPEVRFWQIKSALYWLNDSLSVEELLDLDLTRAVAKVYVWLSGVVSWVGLVVGALRYIQAWGDVDDNFSKMVYEVETQHLLLSRNLDVVKVALLNHGSLRDLSRDHVLAWYISGRVHLDSVRRRIAYIQHEEMPIPVRTAEQMARE